MSPRVVLLMTGKHVAAEYVADLLAEYGECEASVVSWRPADRPLTVEHLVVGPIATLPAEPGPTDSSAATAEAGTERPEATAAAPPSGVTRVRGAVTWRARRLKTQVRSSGPARSARRAVKGGLSTQFWRSLKRNPVAIRLVTAADVVVALDAASIRAGWQIAQRTTEPAVVYGSAAGRQAVAAARTSSATRPAKSA